jgi:uncharacterized membrane protein YbhN (UPF0104 family)
MFKSWRRDLTLAIQARSGLTPALLIWILVAVVAAILVLVALIALLASSATRRGTKRRAVLERAARTPATGWLLDPKMLGVALRAGRTLGWQRLAAVAILGLLAAQWAFENRERKSDEAEKSS